ncbi:MAG: alpha-L-arabinofuranosidase C-terminal domain-containing protein, partial [Bacteroidota bacterium]
SSIQLLACGHGNQPNSEWNDRLIDGAGKTLRCITDHILTGGRVDAQTDPVELYHAFMGYAAELERRYGKLHEQMCTAGIGNPRVAITELQLFAHFHGETRPDGKLKPETLPRPDTIAEALYHATIVNACIRLGDFVEMLTHSATVNHGGGLRKACERVYANPIHHAHAMGIALADGTPVAVRLSSGTFSTQRGFGHIPPLAEVPVIDAMAVISPSGDLMLMLVHRGADCGAIELTVNVEGFFAQDEATLVTLSGDAWHDRNTLEVPHRIEPQPSRTHVRDGNQLTLTLPPFSLTRVTLKQKAGTKV